MDIDDSAPVISREDIEIDAPVETVWRLHTDVRGWSAWQPDIDTATTDDDELKPGSRFTWSTSGLTITSTVEDVDAPHRIAWGGPAHGIDGRHVWEFIDHGATTTVHTRESWSGAPVDADRDGMQSALDASLRSWLTHLKQRAESA